MKLGAIKEKVLKLKTILMNSSIVSSNFHERSAFMRYVIKGSTSPLIVNYTFQKG